MTALQDTYQSCLRYAAARGEMLIKSMIDDARRGIFKRVGASADMLQRDPLQDALRLLNKYEPFLCRRFPELLLEAFVSTAALDAQKTRSRDPISFEQLELMDEVQVQERVEVARIQQAALLTVDVELKDLNRMICGAQGLHSVLADRNPMRPETYARALRAVMVQSQVAPEVRLIWMQYMGESLGEALVTIYQEVGRMLRQAGVEPAAYLVIQGTGGVRIPDVAGVTAQSHGVFDVDHRPARRGADGMGSADREEKLLTLGHLRRLLAGELDDAEDNGAADWGGDRGGVQATPRQAYAHTVPAAFEALEEMEQVETVIRRLAGRRRGPADAGSPAGSTVDPRHQLRGNPRGMGQALGLEVVGLMVDNIAADGRLLEPVREAVKMLEPALLRLVLKDPRFFSDRQHPARRLLEEITQRSLGFDKVTAEGFDAFMHPVQSAVEALASLPVEGPEPFEVALDALRSEWDQRKVRENAQREEAVQALLYAEQRNLLADRLAREIGESHDLTSLHPAVVAMLLGPWSLVMAQARLNSQNKGGDPGEYDGLVADLIWSASPDQTRGNRDQLVRLIPGLIRKVREGLDGIGFPPARTEEFFDVLMGLHQQTLQPAAVASVADPTQVMTPLPTIDGAPDSAGPTGGSSQGLVMPAETFLEARLESDSRSPFDPTQPMDLFPDLPSLPGPEAAPMHPVDAAGFESLLKPGAWVEFLGQGAWSRSQLTWASPQGKLFMFTSATGDAHAMTRRALQRLYDEGGARLISSQALVDGALDAVAEAALQNSLDLKL